MRVCLLCVVYLNKFTFTRNKQANNSSRHVPVIAQCVPDVLIAINTSDLNTRDVLIAISSSEPVNQRFSRLDLYLVIPS